MGLAVSSRSFNSFFLAVLHDQVRDVIACIADGSRFDEFKARYGTSLVCGERFFLEQMAYIESDVVSRALSSLPPTSYFPRPQAFPACMATLSASLPITAFCFRNQRSR